MENTAQIQKEDFNRKIADYKEIINSFSDLLSIENEALRNYDTDAVTALYEQKTKIVTAYRNLVAYFIKNQEVLKALEETERNNVKELSLKLDTLLKENDTLLKTRMETSKSVMDSIVRIAKITNNANSTSYGSQGKYSPLDNSKNAIAINRTL